MSDIIYHYTSLETLNAILNNVENDELTLRATHVNYLNDNTENEIAVNILKKNLLEYESQLGNISNKKIFNNLDDDKIDFFKNISFDKLPPFIFSLSKEKDSLPMWNTYADKSLGICIGFNKNNIEEYAEKSANTRLIECDYNHNRVEVFIKKNIQQLYNSITISNYFIGVIQGGDKSIWHEFEKMVPLLKDSNYNYEKEWRVVIEPKFDWDSTTNFKDLSFNVVDGLPKPYIDFKVKKDFIKEIVVGPCSNFNLVSKSLAMMLSKIGCKSSINNDFANEHILISSSNCPFRQI
ncbi:DUF2971 domain-containing protein [Winogradskyella sp.]|nr:DUF2971 domain-containing protein [Winogradskyella sp.]